MSLSKFGPRTRSLRQYPWIVNCICSPTRKHKGQTIDVLRHVATLADGSLVRDVADGEVIIRAVFSAEAVQQFRIEQEDSDSSPIEWNQALLLVVKYHTEFQPHRNLAQCEFVLHIDLFRLWDLQEGFHRKHRLVHYDEDARVQKKTKELWEEKQIEWQREEQRKNSKLTASYLSQQNESVASVSLTQLLEEMAKDGPLTDVTPQKSPAETTNQGTRNVMTRQGRTEVTARLYTQEETARQGKKKELARVDKQEDAGNTGENNQTDNTETETVDNREISNPQDLTRPFIYSELLIPDHEQLILQEIAEWKEGYMPEISVTASSEEAGSSDKIDNYVRHTLVDDVSSIETSGQPLSLKKGRKDLTPKEKTNTQGKRRIPCGQQASPRGSGLCPGSSQQVRKSTASPKQRHDLTDSTQQNGPETQNIRVAVKDTGLNVGKTVNKRLSFTDAQPENVASIPQKSSEILNHSGPLPMSDILESQGFIPCLSSENETTSDTSRERVASIEDAASLTQPNVSLEALEKKEEKRLEKLATPSKGFAGYDNVPIPARAGQQSATKQRVSNHTDSDGDQTEGEVASTKHNTVDKEIVREETPYSSSQTDSEPDNQVKRRRLNFSVAKLGSPSPPGKNRKRKDISGQTSSVQKKRNHDEDVIVSAQNSTVMESAVSGVRRDRSKGINLQHRATGEAPSVQDAVNETIVINSSQESISSGDSPSVLTFTRRKKDQNESISHSLPSYQPPRLTQSQNESLRPTSQSQSLSLPLSDSTLTDKAKLLTSLTDMTAPTEVGQKLLQLKFSDKLLKQMVDFYTHE